MKSWKKQLNDEFDKYAPPLSEKVKNAPIMAVERNDTAVRNGNTLLRKRLGIGSLCATMATIILFVCLGIFGVFSPKNDFDNYIFTLEINPAVVFITDKNGNVESVKSLNEDADLILSNETELNKLKNIPLKEAIVIYTDNAAKLGFLDFSENGDVVRLSSTNETDNNMMNEISNSLTSYFCEKGIYAVVVENKLPVKDLCSQMGLPEVKDISNLTSTLNEFSVCYGARINDNTTIEDLYNSYIVGKGLLEEVQKELLDNVSDIVTNAQMISNISTLNMQIVAQSYMDYWTIKDKNPSQEVQELINSMKTALDEYENKFGKSINSLNELMYVVNVYSKYAGQDLESVINSLSIDEFTREATNFVGMLENIGIDVSQYRTLLTKPQTVNEYMEQLETVISLLKNSRFDQYLEIYNEVRSKISENDYDNFVEKIINDYGSLENFWNSHKK